MKLLILLIVMIGPLNRGLTEDHKDFQEYRSKFFGTWKYEKDTRFTMVTWKSDGTWVSVTKENGKLLHMLKGVWWAKDSFHYGALINASESDIPLGIQEATEVLEVHDDYYVIKAKNGTRKKYVRYDPLDKDKPPKA